jgi:hypothetical protein
MPSGFASVAHMRTRAWIMALVGRWLSSPASVMRMTLLGFMRRVAQNAPAIAVASAWQPGIFPRKTYSLIPITTATLELSEQATQFLPTKCQS